MGFNQLIRYFYEYKTSSPQKNDFFLDKNIELLEYKNSKIERFLLMKEQDIKYMNQLKNDLHEFEDVLHLWLSSRFSIPDIENHLETKFTKGLNLEDIKLNFTPNMIPKYIDKINTFKRYQDKLNHFNNIFVKFL